MALTPCAKIISYVPATCGIIAGGISKIYIFDPTLFDFTQAGPISGVVQPYTAITDLGTTTKIYPVLFEQMSAEYDFTMKSDDGVTLGYTHKVMFNVPRINMLASQWGQLIGNQGYCCGIGIILITNALDILVMGEASVNTAPLIPVFYTYQDGTKGNSGKKGSDKNTVNVTITSTEYFRPLIQYTGTVASITALSA